MDTFIMIMAAFGATLLPATLIVVCAVTSDNYQREWIRRNYGDREWIDDETKREKNAKLLEVGGTIK